MPSNNYSRVIKNDYPVCLLSMNLGLELFGRIMPGNEKAVEAGSRLNITFADGVFYEVSGFLQV